MGSYAPAPIATEELVAQVRRDVVEPTLAGMAAEGCPFTGCLYFGLMLTEAGPVVIEYNVRFGDPETQAQLPLIRDDLFEILDGAAHGSIAGTRLIADAGLASVCVVLAADGYPEGPARDLPIAGIDLAERSDGVKIFHAGTRSEGNGVLAWGGRVLDVTCVRHSLADAVAGAYAVIGPGGVHFERMRFRRDIAARALT
jgi:phosphoribosylamine-glycine ligase